MKKTLISITCFLFLLCQVSAQRINVDSLLQKVVEEKADARKLQQILIFYTPEINNDPGYTIEIGLKLLKQSQLDGNIVEASAAYSFLGHGYRMLGNAVKALEAHHKAIELAEKTDQVSLLAVAKNQLAHIYKDRGENDKAIQLYRASISDAEKGSNEMVKFWPLMNMGTVFLAMHQLDSALLYSQKLYELDLKKHDTNLKMIAYLNLAGAHSQLNNGPLAISYYNMALQEAVGTPYTRYTNMVYTALAEHFERFQQLDSSNWYARQAITIVNNTPFFYLSSKAAALLARRYEKINCDSTLKYAQLLKTANDSLSNNKANQQVQLMTFEEGLRQQELAAEKLKAARERQQNIQYVLIALGIIILVSLYLLLSRSFLTSARSIAFFGMIALLIVFEFLNLLLHPFFRKNYTSLSGFDVVRPGDNCCVTGAPAS
jgi:two-component system NtrC family sensor kinase